MSIIIPGMKMPKSWEDCEFSNEFAECTLDNDLTKCAFARMGNGCQLIELPPHGDLIDRAEIDKVYYDDEAFENGVGWLFEYIDKLTPVIPAEEE